ncbi:MAG: NAD(+) synthase [Spirochaetales bacterium]|nr:NAD(+) synthase [Spirochaetales bacterium]
MAEGYDFLRVCCAVPPVKAGDVASNGEALERAARKALEKGAGIVLFPELALTGYTCGDLFFQTSLIEAARHELLRLRDALADLEGAVIVGLPWAEKGGLFNGAAVLAGGSLRGIVPKVHIPNNNEFYESRWFSSGRDVTARTVSVGGEEVPFGTDLLFSDGKTSFALEICEDLWSPLPPSTYAALAGAQIILNPSASNELVGKADYRRGLIRQQSARLLCGYAYASAGPGESTTDTVFGGHSLICEYGSLLGENDRFSREENLLYADFDLEFINHERHNSSSFRESRAALDKSFRTVSLARPVWDFDEVRRPLVRHPFVPSRPEEREKRCREIFSLQAEGLMTRLKHIGCRHVVLGLSGGLDSTLALLVICEAFARLGWDRSGIHCYTMPGFGTTARTKGNAELLCEALEIPCEVVDISEISFKQLEQLEHSPEARDVTYENVQARQRTMFLMNKSNQLKGIVIGTGDLSELALGWCTYNGDHMSMYAVNTGVPKTLVKYLVDYVAHTIEADRPDQAAAAPVLHDIVDTPISPELLPPDEEGNIAQKTEDHVGPYELHDFFLYQVVRCGSSPAKILLLARQAFREVYSAPTIYQWLRTFYWRFFSQQFKRSCLPDGPKVGTIALSPRGDWRMPSDGSVRLWLAELDELQRREPSLGSEV